MAFEQVSFWYSPNVTGEWVPDRWASDGERTISKLGGCVFERLLMISGFTLSPLSVGASSAQLFWPPVNHRRIDKLKWRGDAATELRCVA